MKTLTSLNADSVTFSKFKSLFVHQLADFFFLTSLIFVFPFKRITIKYCFWFKTEDDKNIFFSRFELKMIFFSKWQHLKRIFFNFPKQQILQIFSNNNFSNWSFGNFPNISKWVKKKQKKCPFLLNMHSWLNLSAINRNKSCFHAVKGIFRDFLWGGVSFMIYIKLWVKMGFDFDFPIVHGINKFYQIKGYLTCSFCFAT